MCLFLLKEAFLFADPDPGGIRGVKGKNDFRTLQVKISRIMTDLHCPQ